MRRIVLILLVLVAAALSACDINPSKFGREEAREFTDAITYVKDSRSGLCFAIVASRKTMDTDQSGMGLSEVPCAAVEKLIGK